VRLVLTRPLYLRNPAVVPLHFSILQYSTVSKRDFLLFYSVFASFHCLRRQLPTTQHRKTLLIRETPSISVSIASALPPQEVLTKLSSWLFSRAGSEEDLWPWPMTWPSQVQSQLKSMSTSSHGNCILPDPNPSSLVANTGLLRYEGLPPNFSLGQNMLAGAFAGIAVSFSPSASSFMRRSEEDRVLTVHQEHTVMYPIDAIKVSSIFSAWRRAAIANSHRLECRSSTLPPRPFIIVCSKVATG
jgi:hypothetical protein